MSEVENPVAEAIAWSKLARTYLPYLLVLLGLGGVSVKDHSDAVTTSHEVSHTVLWNEAGDHFQDLVKTNEERWNDYLDLEARLEKLEHRTNN
ncbi:MAG TPA: hypothetical protein VLK33_08185 [Terriglobales bacterium]|nr:hypothetical protein [Terriglobales bacterium]